MHPIRPTIEEFIAYALNELNADAAHRLEKGQPDHGRLCEAYALAQKLDLLLVPRFATAPIEIGLLETRNLDHLIEKIKAADLEIFKTRSHHVGSGPGSVIEHLIAIRGLDTPITVIEQQQADDEAQP